MLGVLVRLLIQNPILFSFSVGGGSAGATLANRLSEMYEYSTLLLEAGGSESLLSDIPIVAATLQMTPIDWQVNLFFKKSKLIRLI